MHGDSDIDIFDAVVHVERDAFRFGVESARASPSVGSEQFEEGLRTGFFRGYEIALETAFMRTCAEEFSQRGASSSVPTASPVAGAGEQAAAIPVRATGLRQGRHTAALIEHINQLPRKNIADFDFEHSMEVIRAEYTACGGTAAMPLLRVTTGAVGGGVGAVGVGVGAVGGGGGNSSRGGVRAGGRPVRVSLDW